MQASIVSNTIDEIDVLSLQTGNYGQLLQLHGLQYKKVDYYWQVGEICKTQGWILHVSVVLSQVGNLVQLIVPFLSSEKVPFKIAMDETVSEDLLIGNLGVAQIGKIISIYPVDNKAALELAKKLIDLTKAFKGPAVPTDICLGNIIYTRYGSFNPIIKTNSTGSEEKYIYDHKGELIRDPYTIPFKLPEGIDWPFKELTDPIWPDPTRYLNRIYKILDVLKADARGNVYKGLYVKSLLQVKNCVLKQGFTNSASDKAGRDIRDRLVWQAELYKELSTTIPIPIIYDVIQENGFTMLVMQYINGDSLFQKVEDINPLSKSWLDLSAAESLILIRYSTEIVSIIADMHKRGYVHRDITPVNFLIDKQNKLVLIDIELAYALRSRKPHPPFTLGTPGFMSPEQQAMKEPTIEQDIYSLGATLIHLLTGLTPIKFDAKDINMLCRNLDFFIEDKEIAATTAQCLHLDPNFRPDTKSILKVLSKYGEKLQKRSKLPADYSNRNLDDARLRDSILVALSALANSQVVSANDLWYSKKITLESHTSSNNKQYAKYPGLAEGMCGPLYLLARLHKVGFNIEVCRTRFIKGWQFIQQDYLNNILSLSPGLFNGSAGIALALAQGIQSGLLEDNSTNRENIQMCLSLPHNGLNVANGIAGQGLAILQCRALIDSEVYINLLDKIIDHLLCSQQKDASWIEAPTKKKTNRTLDLNHDDTGIIWFLLEYFSKFPKAEVQKAIENAMGRMRQKKEHMRHLHELTASRASYGKGDGGKGMILMLIKAFEIFGDDNYKQMAVDCLLKYPPRIVNPNFTQYNGMAGLGELYLEAWRILKSEEWKNRADWIANVYQHTLIGSEDGAGYWIMEEHNPPTADFFIGISGVIHFLARCRYPGQIGYRLLN